MAKAFAHDIAVANEDGVTIYYNYTNDGTELAVTYSNSYSRKYSGEVVIPESVIYNGKTYSVTSIGYAAFRYCSDLTSVTIPNSVTEIGNEAFWNCSSLTSVTIGNSVTEIGSSAFYYCSSLTSVTIPNSVTSIGEKAFYYCSSLTSVTIGNSVTSIGNFAFYNCSSLTSVTIPNSVTEIGSSAFYNCSSLTSVTIPNSVTEIGNAAFSGTNLEHITVESGNPSYDSRDNCNAIIQTNNNTLIIGCKNTHIPNSVTEIGYYAFYYCSGLTSVTIPNSVTEIGKEAFTGCSNLKEVTINSNSIMSESFSSSSNLKNIFGSQVTNYEIGNSVTSIGSYAFYNCSDLTSVTIGNSVTEIGYDAFSYCSSLTSVTIGNSVTSIGYWAFRGCSGLTSLVMPDNITSIGYDAFNNVPQTALQVKRGTKSLLSLWKAGYEPCELGTKNALSKPVVEALSTTQTTLTIKAGNIYNEYKYYLESGLGYHDKENRELLLTGLYPEDTKTVYLYISIGDINSDPQPFYIYLTYDFTTAPISPTLTETATSSSVRAIGSFIEGDANVTSQSISIYQGYSVIERAEGNKISMTGLDPNTSYSIEYTIVVKSKRYTTKKSVQTSGLSLTTSQPKVVSLGNVIVAAESNLDDEETNVGFEWRRTDWSNDFSSNTGGAYLYEGTMEGYIRNLNTEKLWKYRPYYLSNSGTYYYGDWVGLDPTNTSYFEPTVHTYSTINIEGNTALVKGYALTGTDKIKVQGFKYWKTVAGTKDREGMNRIASVPSDAMTVEADGQVMTANLTGLDYNSTYHYLAFVTTAEGDTYYGEEQMFSTGDDPAGIEGVQDDAAEQQPATIVARYNMNGQQISSPQKGINILRMSDGTVKKVLVR